jgi:hypothetical protein
MPLDRPIRVSVDTQRHLVPRPYVVELRLLEIRPHPDVVRNEHRQRGARLRELPDGAGKLHDASGLRRGDDRIGEIEVRLVALGICLGEVRLGAAALSLQHDQLPRRRDEPALRRLQRGLVLALPRRVLLGILHGAPAVLREVRVTRRLLLPECQARLLLLHLR